MAVFSDAASTSPLSVEVGRFVVMRAKVVPNENPILPPTWGSWSEEKRLKFTGAFQGSTVAGMSYATLTLAPFSVTGRGSGSKDVRMENIGAMEQGDRIAVGVLTGNLPINWIFAGYQTQGSIQVSDRAESLTFRIVGPEWVWGGAQMGGTSNPVVGQFHRTSQADDAWVANPSGYTAFNSMARFTAVRCVFNPDGKKNMSVADVELNADGRKGRCFETPDRPGFCAFWTMKKAVDHIFSVFNQQSLTGIVTPSVADLPDTRIVETDVDGLGLWDAVRKVIGPEYQLYVDCRPSTAISGSSWGKHVIRFYRRGIDVDGTEAELWLNEIDTPIGKAKSSIVRIEAVKDIGKTVNKVTVLGSDLRCVKLQYWGSKTTTLGSTDKKLALQHGWAKSDLDLSLYQSGNVIDVATIQSKTTILQDDWRKRYTTSGALFPANMHVMRLFIWNESGEKPVGDGPVYGPPPGTLGSWFAPDLTGIADGDGTNAGLYMRRRRKLLDTVYRSPGTDARRRVRPTLFIALVDPTNDALQTDWYRVQTSHYRIDEERSAVWITHPDLSRWVPLAGQKDPVEATTSDSRTFATLLWTGKLRLMLEATVTTDHALTAVAERQSDSGSPLVREAVVRADKDFVRSRVYADGYGSPTGMSDSPIDASADAMTLAQENRQAGQDQQTHASILVAADWPRQAIGKLVNATKGRGLNLRAGTAGAGPGAQIVAMRMDPVAMKWELLTETVALQLRRRDRLKVGDTKPLKRDRLAKRQRTSSGVIMPAELGTPA
jgi:hypothetical protein